MTPDSAYAELLSRSREATLIASCANVLEWDQETYMPAGGVEHRGEQLGLLAGLAHERATDPRIAELLAAVEGSALVRDPDAPESVNVRELRRGYDRETRLPRALVEEIARTTPVAHQEWTASRRASDFARFRPWLEKIVALKRQEAECVGYAASPYDALLDDYEQGATAAETARLFDALRAELVPLVRAIAGAPRRGNASALRREIPVERQRAFGEVVAAALGFDFACGRLDTSAHPFCTGIGPGDCRLTTRFDPHDFTDGLYSIVHEVGHGLYDQGLPPAHYGTPMGQAADMGVHESQSRLWENRVGRSRAFWEHFLPVARASFGGALDGVSLDALHEAVNVVAPSLIRVSADEVTYNLHVLIRFELERALLSGSLSAADVPGAWNEAYARYLGVTPADDAEGCLQDSHWSGGLFGYFPTYTVGNVCAAQLVAAAERDLGPVDELFRRGEFVPLLGWMREHVHRHGRRDASASALVRRLTGEPLDHRPLVDSLRRKYGELYAL